MLTELCQELKNWFVHEVHQGEFSIENGNIKADWLKDGQYFRIIGSIFSDGVHQYPATSLTDEEFSGAVWGLAIPEPVIHLSEEIDAWREKYSGTDSAAMSPFASESFGGYSYSKGSSANGGQLSGADWKTAFASALNRWRKI